MRKCLLVLPVAATVLMSSCGSGAEPAASLSDGGFSRSSVIVDAGHGGIDGGGVSINGAPEKGINLNISLALADMLTLFGYDVTLTRTEDVMICDEGTEGLRAQKLSDMENRLEMFNTPDSVCVSVHQNRYTDEQYSGAQMFYYRENAESARLAETLRARICAYLQPENERETKPVDDELYLLCNCENPAVMAECGFISNAAEAALLETEEYQRQMAFAIMCGINDFHIATGRIIQKNLENKR